MTSGASGAGARSGEAPDDAADEVVRIELPATSNRLRLVRLAVAGLATDHGADVDDLEDIRMATGEICSHLVNRAEPGDRLTVEVRVSTDDSGGSALVVSARVDGLGDLGPFDELSEMVLATTASAHGIEVASDGDSDSASCWFRRALHASDSVPGGHEASRPFDA